MRREKMIEWAEEIDKIDEKKDSIREKGYGNYSPDRLRQLERAYSEARSRFFEVMVENKEWLRKSKFRDDDFDRQSWDRVERIEESADSVPAAKEVFEYLSNNIKSMNLMETEREYDSLVNWLEDYTSIEVN